MYKPLQWQSGEVQRMHIHQRSALLALSPGLECFEGVRTDHGRNQALTVEDKLRFLTCPAYYVRELLFRLCNTPPHSNIWIYLPISDSQYRHFICPNQVARLYFLIQRTGKFDSQGGGEWARLLDYLLIQDLTLCLRSESNPE